MADFPGVPAGRRLVSERRELDVGLVLGLREVSGHFGHHLPGQLRTHVRAHGRVHQVRADPPVLTGLVMGTLGALCRGSKPVRVQVLGILDDSVLFTDKCNAFCRF